MLAALAVSALLQGTPASEPPRDLRSVILVQERCASVIASRDLTLFANGTVRLREGPAGEVQLRLGELGPPELEAFVSRLAEIDFSESDDRFDAPGGDWLEICELQITPLAGEAVELSYARYATGNLELDRLRKILDELVELARRASHSSGYPHDYVPEVGDLVERADGTRFEIVGYTSDGLGIELTSIDGLITLFIGRTEVRTYFPRFVSRAERP